MKIQYTMSTPPVREFVMSEEEAVALRCLMGSANQAKLMKATSIANESSPHRFTIQKYRILFRAWSFLADVFDRVR